MTERPETRGQFHPVARLAELVDDAVLPIEVDGVSMILFRAGPDVVATQRRCPHQGTDLVDGLVLNGGILCGSHGWRFDGRTGQHDSSSACLAVYAVRVVGDVVEVAAIRRGLTPAPG